MIMVASYFYLFIYLVYKMSKSRDDGWAGKEVFEINYIVRFLKDCGVSESECCIYTNQGV